MFLKPHNAGNKIVVIAQPPLVVMSTLAHQKMSMYIDLNDKEIGWLGSVEQLPNNILYIKDVYLFKQQVHATTCELTAESLGEFATELLAKPDGMELYNSMLLWGHSHVDMGVTPSVQDDEQVTIFQKNGCPWFLRCIGNKKGAMQFTFYDWTNGIQVNDVSWVVEQLVYDGLKEQVQAEIESKVSNFTYNNTSTVIYSSITEEDWEAYENTYLDKKGKAKNKKKTTPKLEDGATGLAAIKKLPGYLTFHDDTTLIFSLVAAKDIYFYFDDFEIQDALSITDFTKLKEYIEDIIRTKLVSYGWWGDVKVTHTTVEMVKYQAGLIQKNLKEITK